MRLIAVLVILKAVLLFYYYNTFLSMQYDVDEAKAQVDTELQRRKNIILGLNIMVVDYAKHEKELFQYAADSRKEMFDQGSGKSSKDGSKTPTDLQALLSKVVAVAERYPDLRLSENFQRYMDGLVDAETKIAERRIVLNQKVNIMSTEVGKFPGFLFATFYGFESPVFFIPEDESLKPPTIEKLKLKLTDK